MRIAWLVVVLLGCKGSSPAPERALDAPPVVTIDAMIPVDAMPVDAAPIDAAPVPIDAAPAPKKPKAKKRSRDDCFAECRKRNMYTDCAGDEGMMPCPCNCN